jgi:hypothetical protein
MQSFASLLPIKHTFVLPLPSEFNAREFGQANIFVAAKRKPCLLLAELSLCRYRFLAVLEEQKILSEYR